MSLFYTIEDYQTDAEQVYRDRIVELRHRTDLASEQVLAAMQQGVQIDTFFDPVYAAKWSTLTRKLKSGIILQYLVDIAESENLDMTAVLAQRLAKGWTDRSISNRKLIEVFGKPTRTAADKSEDFNNLDHLIETHKEAIQKALYNSQNQIEVAKEKAWEKVDRERKR